MSFYVQSSAIMKPRLPGIHSNCLLVTLLFLETQESSAQHFILLDWAGYWWLISCTDLKCYVFCLSKQLCLAVSLISTAANSAWDGGLGVERRQGCTETVVEWQEGTDGRGKGCKVLHFVEIQESWLMISFSPQDESEPNTCDVPGIKWVAQVNWVLILYCETLSEYCSRHTAINKSCCKCTDTRQPVEETCGKGTFNI